jgi:hypothetical protein
MFSKNHPVSKVAIKAFKVFVIAAIGAVAIYTIFKPVPERKLLMGAAIQNAVLDTACINGVSYYESFGRPASVVVHADGKASPCDAPNDTLGQFESRYRVFCSNGTTVVKMYFLRHTSLFTLYDKQTLEPAFC